MTALPHLPPTPRDHAEHFSDSGRSLGFSLGEFWQWQGSDLLSNAQRGILAEFIVAQALSSTAPVREEWSAFDVRTPDGVTVEVKSSAYLQSWYQARESKISFDICPTLNSAPDTTLCASGAVRQAQVYVFCLFAARDKATANPLDLDQWEFYVLSTRVLNEKVAGQETIRLNPLLKLGAAKACYATLREAVAGAAG
jgi:hypothetical protein